jgi:hypothetical protein
MTAHIDNDEKRSADFGTKAMTKQKPQAQGAIKHAAPEKKKTDWFWWWENPTDRFSFLLVFVTFLLFGATVGLYCATRNLVEDAERATERQLRAYLSGKPVRIFSFSPSIVAEIESTITNHGQTPASRVRITGLVDILPYPLPPNHPFPILPVPKSTSVIHPGGTIQGHSIASHLFAENEIARVVNGKTLGSIFLEESTTRIFLVKIGGQHFVRPLSVAIISPWLLAGTPRLTWSSILNHATNTMKQTKAAGISHLKYRADGAR